MLWALGQPAAAVGLAGAFLLGLLVRAVARWCCVRPLLGFVARPRVRDEVDPVGAVAVLLGGTGWGRSAPLPVGSAGRRALVLLAGPVAVLLLGEAALGGFLMVFPGDRLSLALNHPSDVLRGVVAPSFLAQALLSLAVGLVCFGLVALVPVPPL